MEDNDEYDKYKGKFFCLAIYLNSFLWSFKFTSALINLQYIWVLSLEYIPS